MRLIRPPNWQFLRLPGRHDSLADRPGTKVTSGRAWRTHLARDRDNLDKRRKTTYGHPNAWFTAEDDEIHGKTIRKPIRFMSFST